MSRIHASDAVNGGAAQRQSAPDRGPIGQRRRALDAMARAAGRARDPTRAAVVTDVPHNGAAHDERLAIVAPEDRLGSALTRPSSAATPPRTPRRMRLAIVAEVAALVALLTTFVIVRFVGVDAHPRPASSTGVANGKAATLPASTSTVPAAPVQTSPTTTGTAAVAPSPDAPALSELAPPQGTTGEVVAVTGTNLFSADGQVVTRFGAQVAATQCPTQTTCTVTVPPGTGAPSTIPVTITTSSGTSNALLFTYQAATQPTTQVAPNDHQDPAGTAPSGTEGHGKHASADGGGGRGGG